MCPPEKTGGKNLDTDYDALDRERDQDDFRGYSGAAKDFLKVKKVRVWSDVVIESSRGRFEGVILPRSEILDDLHLVLKLKTGYNVGVAIENITSISEIGYKKGHYRVPEGEFPKDPKKPYVKLFGTGGTIASRLDYRTGAVIPAFTPGELYGAVPELADHCNLNTEKLYGVFSENMTWKEYSELAVAIGKQIEEGIDGIMVGHGTDTMHYTSAALSFMIQNQPVPIVIVGSQRSSDRPSSDAALNLINAARAAAYYNVAETMVCLFGPTSDLYCLLHRGTRVRKMHSAYRSTFRTIGDIPLGWVSPTEFRYFRKDYNPRRMDREVKIDPVYDDRVSIVYYYPAMKPDIIDSLVDKGYLGIVIAGTGLGHVNKPLYEPIRRAVEQGIHVYMTVETLWGYVQMFVYDTGRDLLRFGVVPCKNMLPETAYIKLGWALGHSQNREEVRDIMLAPVCGEITPREPPNGYMILQGGIPECDEFQRKYMK